MQETATQLTESQWGWLGRICNEVPDLAELTEREIGILAQLKDYGLIREEVFQGVKTFVPTPDGLSLCRDHESGIEINGPSHQCNGYGTACEPETCEEAEEYSEATEAAKAVGAIFGRIMPKAQLLDTAGAIANVVRQAIASKSPLTHMAFMAGDTQYELSLKKTGSNTEASQ